MIVGYEAVGTSDRRLLCLACHAKLAKFTTHYVPLFQAEVKSSDICTSCGEKLQKEDGCPA